MEAHQILSDETKWIKGNYAVDAAGLAVSPDEPYAVCFCVYGAVAQSESCFPISDASATLLSDAAKAAGYLTISSWNDAPERTFQEAKELLVKLGI